MQVLGPPCKLNVSTESTKPPASTKRLRAKTLPNNSHSFIFNIVAYSFDTINQYCHVLHNRSNDVMVSSSRAQLSKKVFWWFWLTEYEQNR